MTCVTLGELAVSAAESAFGEKLPFGVSGLAAKAGVSMREAAEAGDDVSVKLRPFDKLVIAGRLEQLHGARLVAAVFRMFEREVEECAQFDRIRLVEASFDGASGDEPGE